MRTTTKLLTMTGAVAALAFPVLAPGASDAQTTTREYEGTVLSVDRDARTFRLRDTERGTATFRVTRSTRYERVNGFSALRRGQKNIEVTARRSGSTWIALEVERSGGGGEHGGDDHDDD